MFRALLGNTLASSVAFLLVGLVGLLLVPVLLHGYGLAGLGLIMLARLFLPGAGIGIFDFGISEIATQTVATARTDGNWARAEQRLSVLAALALVTSVLVATPLALLASPLALAFGVVEEQRPAFAGVLRATAALLPLLFIGLLIEGCLKGHEGFKELRGAEVLSTVAFATAAVVATQHQAAFEWIVGLHLASQVLRVLLITLGLRRRAHRPLRLERPRDSAARVDVVQRAGVFFASRLLGTAQHHSPTILIGLIVGPQGVGLYDTLARLPRFAKSVLGILNTTLLPYATRLDAAGDERRLHVLTRFGFTLLPMLILPPIAAIAALSGPVLGLWIGDTFRVYGPWLALFWALPALNSIVSFQNYALMTRIAYVKASNQMAATQVCIQTVISLALVAVLDQFAFIVGYIGAAAMLFGWQLELARREVGTPPALRTRLLVYSALLALLVTAALASGAANSVRGPLILSIAALTTSAALAAAGWALFLERTDRQNLSRMLSMLRRHPA